MSVGVEKVNRALIRAKSERTKPKPAHVTDVDAVIAEYATKKVETCASDHIWFKCDCTKMYCQFRDGGLRLCTVCNGFEGTLTSHCPKTRMTEGQEDAVYKKGTLDFYEGTWREVRQHDLVCGCTDARLLCTVSGGLHECNVCRGEGWYEMTTECPGSRMSVVSRARCADGTLDYRHGRWFEDGEAMPPLNELGLGDNYEVL